MSLKVVFEQIFQYLCWVFKLSGFGRNHSVLGKLGPEIEKNKLLERSREGLGRRTQDALRGTEKRARIKPKTSPSNYMVGVECQGCAERQPTFLFVLRSVLDPLNRAFIPFLIGAT